MLKPFSRATNRVFPCREKLKFNIYRRGNLTTEFSVSLTLQINNQILQRLHYFFSFTCCFSFHVLLPTRIMARRFGVLSGAVPSLNGKTTPSPLSGKLLVLFSRFLLIRQMNHQHLDKWSGEADHGLY